MPDMPPFYANAFAGGQSKIADDEMGMTMKRKVVAASEFRAKCSQFIREVQQTGGEIVITKRGEPGARLVPVGEKRAPLFGRRRGTVKFRGDIVAPTGEEWDAAR